MILSMIDRYISLSINRVKIERLLKKSKSNNNAVINDLKRELEIVNAAINYLYEKIINRITLLTAEELKNLSKCLERKAKQIKEKIDETDTLLKISSDNKQIAEKGEDETAIETYDKIIEQAIIKKSEQQEELNCYDCTLSLCYKMRYIETVAK